MQKRDVSMDALLANGEVTMMLTSYLQNQQISDALIDISSFASRRHLRSLNKSHNKEERFTVLYPLLLVKLQYIPSLSTTTTRRRVVLDEYENPHRIMSKTKTTSPLSSSSSSSLQVQVVPAYSLQHVASRPKQQQQQQRQRQQQQQPEQQDVNNIINDNRSYSITYTTSTRRRALLGGCAVLAAAATATSSSSVFTATAAATAMTRTTATSTCLFMMLPTAAAAAATFVRRGSSLAPCRRYQRDVSFSISHSRLFTTRTTTTATTSSSSSSTTTSASTTPSAAAASSTKVSTTSAASSTTSLPAPSHHHSLLTQISNRVALRHSDFFPDSNTSQQQQHHHHQQQSAAAEAAPPVVFLHGLLGNRRNFATIARSLAAQLQTKRRLLAVDLRNHGDTAVDQTRPSMTYTEMAADVLDFLNTHQMDKAVLVGHSMGGKVAQALALLAPERVQGLVVLDMAPVSYTQQDAHWKAVVDILHVLNNVPPDATSKKQVEMYLQPHISDPALRAFCLTNWNASTGTWNIPMADIVQSLEHLADFAIPTDKQYVGDVFLIHGGQSRFVRHSYMPTIAQYFPNHLLTTIKGAGHWVHAEAPEDTTALLKRYLDR